MSLSDRIRPDCEAAPWLIKEVKQLEIELAEAKTECARLRALGSWAHTCIHHTDEQRARAERCPVCAREKVRVLREALENLCDEQNGPPLCTREAEWKEAMDKADAALAATKEELS